MEEEVAGIFESFTSSAQDKPDKNEVLRAIDKAEQRKASANENIRDVLVIGPVNSAQRMEGAAVGMSRRPRETDSPYSERTNEIGKREPAVSRESLYTALEKKQQELDAALKQRADDREACEKEIAAYLQEKQALQAQVETMKRKSRQFDAVQGGLKRIFSQAQSNASKMVEEAKEQSMDAVSIVDDISKEVSNFKSDVKNIRCDITIGTRTAEDRLDSLYYALDSYVQKLQNIKIQFYKANSIPLDEQSYDYMDIANNRKPAEAFLEDSAAGEAAEDRMPDEEPGSPVALLHPVEQNKPLQMKPFGEAAEENADETFI